MEKSPALQTAIDNVKKLRATMNSKPVHKQKAYVPTLRAAVNTMRGIEKKEKAEKDKAYHEEMKNVVVESEFEYLGPDIEPFDLGEVENPPLEVIE